MADNEQESLRRGLDMIHESLHTDGQNGEDLWVEGFVATAEVDYSVPINYASSHNNSLPEHTHAETGEIVLLHSQ